MVVAFLQSESISMRLKGSLPVKELHDNILRFLNLASFAYSFLNHTPSTLVACSQTLLFDKLFKFGPRDMSLQTYDKPTVLLFINNPRLKPSPTSLQNWPSKLLTNDGPL